MSKLFIGTSGWVYEDWWKRFYPIGTKPDQRLEYYSKRFDTVELNASFYHLPRKKTFENWSKKTLDSFSFSVKLSKYITHNLKLKNVKEPLALFLQEAKGLGNKLSVVLVQLPPNLHVNKERLEDFLNVSSKLSSPSAARQTRPPVQLGTLRAVESPRQKSERTKGAELAQTGDETDGMRAFARFPRFAFEFRHESWLDNEIYKLLRKYKAGFVIQDSAGRWPVAEVVTSDFVYLRFHGPGVLYSSNYTDKILKEWASKINNWLGKGLDVYAYFNNDVSAYAIKNALALKEFINR